MKKNIIGKIKLELIAGQATPAPPVGPSLGRFGLNLIKFCKEYNTITSHKKGDICPVQVIIYEDKSFSLKIRTKPTSKLILEILNKSKGSSLPNKNYIGSLNSSDLEKLAIIKQPDLLPLTIPTIIKMIKGTASSIGIELK